MSQVGPVQRLMRALGLARPLEPLVTDTAAAGWPGIDGEDTSFEHDTPPPDLAGKAESPEFRATVERVREAVSSPPAVSYEHPCDGDRVGGLAVLVSDPLSPDRLARLTRRFLPEGTYVFRLDHAYGRAPDRLGVLPTTDPFEVLRAVNVDGVNYGITNAYVIKFLRRVMADYPFLLTGACYDTIEGVFEEPPVNDLALARQFEAFCQDIVEQGTGSVEALARDLNKGHLFFWWD